MATSVLANTTTIYYGQDDPVIRHPALSSPVFVGSVMALYLLFVKVWGPSFMASRKPYELKYPMLIYNFVMVLLNTYLIFQFIGAYGQYPYGGLKYFWEYACHPLDKATNPLMIIYINGVFQFYLTKICDLLDTVFFVLRKKQNQISFLHLFHHTSMVLSTWMSVYLVREEIGALFGVINTIVHVIMYSYYFLSALGPRVQKYLWWKRYITQIQIVQFMIVIGIIVRLSTNECSLDPMFKYLWGTNAALFLGLFINFYIRAYSK